MTKRVIAYIRVSTDNQVEKYGMDAQEMDIRVYCSKNDMEIVRVLREEGVSGAKEDRPVFNEILYGGICDDGIDAIVVAKNDRVARDINIYYYFKMQLKKKGIELISVAEDFGEMGIMAHFLEAFTMCVAEMERENIKNRTSAGRKVKAENGGFAGGGVPYGYNLIDRKLVVDRDAADIVKKVFLLRGCGKKLQEISDLMNESGIRTKRGKEFTVSTVQNILKNEKVYKGQLTYGGKTYEGNHERIL